MKPDTIIRFLTAAFIAALLYSCANIGHPNGGAIDVLPPIFIGSNPEQGALNVNRNKVELNFDEIIVIREQSDKVVVSPVQKTPAQIRANGKKITIEFRDSLIPNTTYSIDFSDAIEDNNEGNPLEGFSFAFSTGETIDSMQISGIVLNSRTLEPQQKKLVGIHKDLSDSAFLKTPFYRIARTNDLGHFTIRNLPHGKYHIFALNDIDRDNTFANPQEDIAFLDSIIIPTAEPVDTYDTIRTITHEIDTIIPVRRTHFFPNDILLSMFNEERQTQYLVKSERQDSNKIFLQFGAKADTLPTIELISPIPTKKDWYRIEYSEKNDSVTYWLTDPLLMATDSLKVSIGYMHPDSLQRPVFATDTISLVHRKPKKAPVKEKRIDKYGNEIEDTVPKIDYLSFRASSQSIQDVHLPVYFVTETPIDTILQSGVHLEIEIDSVWTPINDIVMESVSERLPLFFKIDYDWTPEAHYKITVDSAAVTGIYGKYNSKLEHEFKIKSLDEYSNLSLKISGLDSVPAVVELLNSSDKVVRRQPVEDGSADILYVKPDTYYARLFLDRNGNGEYDTGNYLEKIQPEETFYYNKKLVLKKNWDVTQNWDIYEIPVDKQKPDVIKKNQPKQPKWKSAEKDENSEEEEDSLDDGNNFGINQFSNQNRNQPFNRR